MKRLILTGIGGLAALIVTAVTAPPAYSHKPITTPVIFKREIAQVFQRKCFQCHSDNNVAMSLTTYELARPWARAIREEVLERRMPPWGAVAGFGHFSNDISLTQREMDIILSWADGGAPSGVLKAEESIPPVFVPSKPEWGAGAPDVVLAPEKPFAVEAGSPAARQRFELTTALTETRRLKGLAFRPGDRRVVRYAVVSDAATGRWLWTWTPWQTSMTLPENVVYQLPARAKLTLEIGYRGVEEPATDKSELGLYFASSTSAHVAVPVTIGAARPVAIAPGAASERVRAEAVLSSSEVGFAIWPDLGEGARAFELKAIAPDGIVEPLLWVKDFRSDWQTPYVLAPPVTLRRGTKLILTTYFDNRGERPLQVQPRVTLMKYPADASSH
jgi:hypothetical protein